MTKFPDDILLNAFNVARRWYHEEWDPTEYIQQKLVEGIAQALLEERERNAAQQRSGAVEADDPVTTVYGRLLWYHMDAMRKGDKERRGRAFQASELLQEIWPVETKIWEDRYA